MTRIEHKGAARITVTTAEIDPTSLVIPLAESDNWPDGAIGLFYLSMGKGTPTEEKILCSGRSGLTVQVWSGTGGTGRGADGTVAQTHPINTPVEHIWTAVEADEANAHIESADGAHGYPPKATLVTLAGAQTISDKTLTAPILTDPAATGGTHTGGTHTAATKLSVAGAQAEQEYRVRNTFIGDRDPLDSEGSDGDIWIRKG